MNTSDNFLDKCFQLSKSVEKNIHLLDNLKPEHYKNRKVGYNDHIVISDSVKFLEAVRNDVGGEIIRDPKLGTFLYLGEISNN
jgi:hypothetical protein